MTNLVWPRDGNAGSSSPVGGPRRCGVARALPGAAVPAPLGALMPVDFAGARGKGGDGRGEVVPRPCEEGRWATHVATPVTWMLLLGVTIAPNSLAPYLRRTVILLHAPPPASGRFDSLGCAGPPQERG